MANPTKITVSGLTPVTLAAGTAAAASGDVVAARVDATYCFIVANGGGSPDVLKLNDFTSASPDGATQFDPDAAMTITNGTTRAFWVRDPRRFINPATGNIEIAHSQTTSVTVQVLELL